MCYSVWIALLLMMVKHSGKWNKATKADTSKLDALAEAANAEVAKEQKKATGADWVFLIGLALIVSALSQKVGLAMIPALNPWVWLCSTRAPAPPCLSPSWA